jgi:hypothetical protein
MPPTAPSRIPRRHILFAAPVLLAGPALLAQAPANPPAHATLSDPSGPPPDPTHIPFVLPNDLKWTGDPMRQETAVLYGDQAKAGPYGILIKWHQGAFSRPHFHDQPRWIYVVSGTWWVSSSNVYDEKKTYPFRAGTFSIDRPNWVLGAGCRIGARAPATILLTGIGPVMTTQVGEDGKPLPPAGR